MSKRSSSRLEEESDNGSLKNSFKGLSFNDLEDSEEKPKPSEKTVQKNLLGVKLRLRVNTNYKITGKYSGQKYYFQGAGSTQDVNETDVDWMLNLRRSKACCGGGGGINIFELAGE